MDSAKIIEALNSDTRRLLLVLLNKHRKASMQDLVNMVSSIKPTARENIYRHLEILVRSGLLKKQYDPENKKLNYVRSVELISFKITNKDIEVSLGVIKAGGVDYQNE